MAVVAAVAVAGVAVSVLLVYFEFLIEPIARWALESDPIGGWMEKAVFLDIRWGVVALWWLAAAVTVLVSVASFSKPLRQAYHSP